jgi:hypothetical protein
VRAALWRKEDDILNVVWKVIERDCGWLLEQLSDPLRANYIRILIQQAILRIVADSAAAAFGEAGELDPLEVEPEDAQTWFAGMEVFREVTDAVSYLRRDGAVRYMLYRHTLQEHREGMERLDRQQEIQDATQRRIRRNANEHARRMVAEFGNLPLEKLVSLWVEKHGSDSAQASG